MEIVRQSTPKKHVEYPRKEKMRKRMGKGETKFKRKKHGKKKGNNQ